MTGAGPNAGAPDPPSGPQRFYLRPFPGETIEPDLGIDGTVEWHGGRVVLDCATRGGLDKLSVPPPDASPERRDRLWEETCLELFLAETGADRYWEFHLSPAGHWNVFRFSSYRRNRRPEPAFASLPAGIRRTPEGIRFRLELAIGSIVPDAASIELAVCAVTRTVRGKTIHWALVHPGPRPDFHRREGFGIVLRP